MRFPPGIGEGVVLLNFGQPLLEIRPCRFEVCGEWSKGLACAWERLTRVSMSARKCYDRYELSGTEAVSLARARKQSVGSAAIVPPSSSMPPNSNKTATCNT